MTQNRPERRARTVAMMGLVFQLLLTAFFIILFVWSESEAMRGLAYLTGVGTTIWLFLVLVYHQRVLVQDETFESEQLRRERETGGAIFDMDDEQLLLARRRLRWMYKWMLPGFTLLIVAGMLAAALIRWPWTLGQGITAEGWPKLQNEGLLTWFVAGSAFLAFLFSRYATGMARQPEWRLLRAGASYLMGVTLASVAVALALAATHADVAPSAERIVAYALRVLLLVLAAEITLNFVLDFYRPRSPDEEPRPAFESRLLGLFSEPGGIARSIADAMNYQFGFEVSSTWFYQLLQRSVVPLMIFAAAALMAASSLAFIGTNEQALVERFGVPIADGEGVRILGPGLHFKYPWPIDIVRKVATSTVHELKIGVSPENKSADAPKEELILWTNKHEQEPHLEVMVATPKLASYLNVIGTKSPSATQPAIAVVTTQPAVKASEAVPVSLLRVAVSLQYRIRDVSRWVAGYREPERMLEAIANREIMRSCASVEVAGLLGPQREAIEQSLHQTIQKAADQAGLNIDIVFLGLQGVHPPETTAEDFQDVVGAEQKKTATIRSAEADAKKRLSEAAGSEDHAKLLADSIRKLNALEGQADVTDENRAEVLEQVERLLRQTGGEAAQRIAAARARRWQLENATHGQALAFVQEMAAKNAAPDVYRLKKVLSAVADTFGDVRKYILTGDSNGTLQLNLQDPMSAGIDAAISEQRK